MFDSLIETTRTLLETNQWLAVLAVFLGGVTTAANPCSLAGVPVLISLVGGHDSVSGWRRGFVFSLVFVCGLATSFSVMAFLAVSAGSYFGETSGFWPWVLAGVCFLAAGQFFDLVHFSLPEAVNRYRPKISGLTGAYVMGALFGVLSAPCAAPVLVLVLTYVASRANLPYGILLLWVYAVGHCLLVIAAGTSLGLAKHIVASTSYSRTNSLFRKGAGAVILSVGIYLVYKQLSAPQ